MAGTLYLKHVLPNELPDQKFYFYEGEVDVHFGVIEIPLDGAHWHWAQKAWVRGFRLSAETGADLSLGELFEIYEGREPVVAVAEEAQSTATPEETPAESAESTGETNVASEEVQPEAAVEVADGGGQPVGDDGVREGELARPEGVPVEGLDGGVGDGAAVEDGGDGTPAPTV